VYAWPERAISRRHVKLARTGEAAARRWRIPLVESVAALGTVRGNLVSCRAEDYAADSWAREGRVCGYFYPPCRQPLKGVIGPLPRSHPDGKTQ
jgi:hypothetical protein